MFGEVGRHGRAGAVIVAFLIIFTSVFGEVGRHGRLWPVIVAFPDHIHECVWESRTSWEGGDSDCCVPDHIHKCVWGSGTSWEAGACDCGVSMSYLLGFLEETSMCAS